MLPVYNAERTLRPTLESILGQQFADFELIVVNDGSTDGSAEIIRSFRDSRIKLVDNGENKGLIYSLNRGLDLAVGVYVARMDSDDIMQPQRLLRQLEFMESHTDVDICGCACEIFNDKGTCGKLLFWLKNDAICADLLFNSPLAHPTYFIRRSAIGDLRYSSDYHYCEDYEFLSRFLLSGHKAANLPQKLLRYRQSSNSMSRIGEKKKEQRYQLITGIQTRVLRNALGIGNNPYRLRLHYLLSQSDRIQSMDLNEYPVREISRYLAAIESAARNKQYSNSGAFKLVLGKIWIKLLRYKLRPNLSLANCLRLMFSKYTVYGIGCVIYRTFKY